jgi:phosphopantothenoylcysteine decarboxylase/phosphopantothenate--cysteine ligase
LVAVETAAEMLEALRGALPGADLLVMAAAVADFRPAQRAAQKITREDRSELVLHLQKNTDVLAELAREPGSEGVFRVGFAAETEELQDRAAEKLERKGLDAILANDVGRDDIAFGSEHNAGLLLFRDGTRVEIERVSKREMADRILDAVAQRLT